ncbi:MAG: hypothetical protein AABX55_02460, partial [Nanoarchaeota archaeon]
MKKSQVQIQESILVILIITIIIGLALFVFYRFNLASLEKTKLEYEQNQVFTLLATLPNSPELSYTEFSNPQNSLDTLKLLNAKLTNQGFKEIIIKQIYPETSNVICSKENYPDCNSYVIYNNKGNKKNSQILSIPVSLYFPRTQEFKSGLLEIKW